MDAELINKVKTRLSLIPNLSGLSQLDDGAIDVLVEDAINQAYADGFKATNVAMAASYLCAHFVSVATATDKNISKQTASVLTVEYFDRKGTDEYLEEYNRLKGVRIKFL